MRDIPYVKIQAYCRFVFSRLFVGFADVNTQGFQKSWILFQKIVFARFKMIALDQFYNSAQNGFDESLIDLLFAVLIILRT